MADHPKGFYSSEKQSLTEASFMQDVPEPKADSNILNLSSEQCHLQDVGSDHESVKDSEPSSNSASEYEEEDATPSFTAAAVKALLSKQGQETGEVMRGLLKEFMGKSSERPVEGRPVAKTCLPSTYTHEEISGSSETNFTVDQCPVTDAGPYEKRQWVEGMTSYKKDLEEALVNFSPSEIQVRREKYLRSAANGMTAYLKAKEDGPLIALEVSGIAEKIRGNPNQAEEIKAGEEETLLELKNSISALNARWAKFCGKPQVLQELKDALQALNAAGKTPSKSATAREINVLNYVSPFSGQEEAVRSTFERWRRDWEACHDAIMAAGATEADAFHRLLAAMAPGSPAHALVLRYQRSPSQCYSLAMKALEEAYGDLVRMATDLIAPAPASKKPTEVVQDLLDFLDMEETLKKADVSIGDILAQQKLLAMLPPAYKADEEWPKWVESALRDQAKAAAAANRASMGASPVPTNSNIGTLYKRESLKLFALWLEERNPASSTEAAIFSVSTSVPPKIPLRPRVLKNGTFGGCLCGAQDHKASTCTTVAAWEPAVFYKVATQANACRSCCLHTFKKGEKCQHRCQTCGLGHPTNRHHHYRRREGKPLNAPKRRGSGKEGPPPKKLHKEGGRREKLRGNKGSNKPKGPTQATVDAAEIAKALKSFFKPKEN